MSASAVSPLVLPERMREPERSPMPLAEITPASMIAHVMQQGGTLDQLAQFMAIKREWEADEARKAFNAAFAAFKGEAVKIVKSTQITDGPLKGKFHANLFDVVAATAGPLAKHGLSLSWKLTKDEPAWMEVTCTLRHAAGHAESVSMGAAPDSGPGRNAIQARGSAKSYLERYTATGILGLAASDADDDGAGANKPQPVTDDQAATLQALIDEVQADRPQFLAYMSKRCKVPVASLSAIPASAYPDAVAALNAKRKAPAK